ncbi:hypothetical protein [Bacillus altitudinis]|uniref:hypothetical protein n=1 Tax=Bacillus altitudinis TaxID=293387 RepID=UPI00042F51B2|nr:hypothetical protein [Bacillus altitudinis]AHL73532.1 hypothetical protein BW16_03695 [Bacillus pumilus]KML56519.1 hypothetical protein VL19_17855 [Bacillus stratosphericus]KMN29601.1 hypothetical protein ABW26_18925 [Bacillus stratosphericus]MCL7873676.1 hypothetical protein [Bacillus altitudinis]QII23779.1 hypothetical protein G3M80_04010 [Bacillus altitudinis]
MKKHFKKITALVVIGFVTIFSFAHLGEASTQKFIIGGTDSKGKKEIVRAEVIGPVKYKLKNKTTKIYSNARIYNQKSGNFSNAEHRYHVAVQKKNFIGFSRKYIAENFKTPNKSTKSIGKVPEGNYRVIVTKVSISDDRVGLHGSGEIRQ